MQVFVTEKPIPATFREVPGMVAWIVPMDHLQYTLHSAEKIERTSGKARLEPSILEELHKHEREAMAEHCVKLEGVPMPDGSTRTFEGAELTTLLVERKPFRFGVGMHTALWDAVGNGPQNVLSDSAGKDSGSPSSPKTT